MNHQTMNSEALDGEATRYPPLARWLHLGLAVFGIAAYLTAEFAEHGARGAGYLVHASLGLSLLADFLFLPPLLMVFGGKKT